MAPERKLLLGIDVGTRTRAMAQRVVPHLVQRWAPDGVPLFLTDGFKEYALALLAPCGHGRQPERRQPQGPMPKPRWRPLPGRLYAQGGKSYRRQRLVGGTHRVVFGTPLALEQGLAACGWTLNTACIERRNLDSRQRGAAVGRRVNTRCRGEEGLRAQLGLCQTSPNFVLPHASLRQPLPVAEATHGGSAKVWRPGTPALAAGWTEHLWALTEVLGYRGPPWPQPQPLYNRMPVEERGAERLVCAPMQANRDERGVENGPRVLITG
jgi:hypothetical protein